MKAKPSSLLTQVASIVGVGIKFSPSKRNYTKFPKNVDTILNVLLDKDLIEILPIVHHHFPHGVLENYRFEEFCNYH